MSPLFGRLIALSYTTILLAACGGARPSEVGRVALRMAYTSRWGDYTMIIADKAGFFDRNHVAIEPVYYPFSYEAVVDVAAEEIDGGLMPIGDAINVASHTKIRVIAISDDGRGYCIIASPEIATLSDLKGKRIGIRLGTWHGLMALEMLTAAGISNTDVIFSNLDPEKVPEALGVEIDAGITWEPFTGIALAKNNRIIFDAGQFTGSFPNVIVLRQSTIEERPEEVRQFLRAWFEAVDFRRNKPDEAARMISAQLDIKQENVATGTPIRILNRLENYSYFQGAASVGLPSLRAITQANAEYLLRIGVLTKQPDPEKLLDSSYLQ